MKLSTRAKTLIGAGVGVLATGVAAFFAFKKAKARKNAEVK